MPITATLDQIPRHRRSGTRRWERLLSFFGASFPRNPSAAAHAAADGFFARTASADPCDPLLFAACLDAERWLAEAAAGAGARAASR